MTSSMIPNSFIPGTKAKAGEVNANFIAFADVIEENKNSSEDSLTEINSDIDEINETFYFCNKSEKSIQNILRKTKHTDRKRTYRRIYKFFGTDDKSDPISIFPFLRFF